MSLIPPSDQERLRADFAGMQHPVRVLFFTQTFDCETCLQARQILDELPELSDKIAIEEVNLVLEKKRAEEYGIDRAPAIALVAQDDTGVERDSKIRFLGAPSGYEFISLIRALLLVGGGPSLLSEASRTRLAQVDAPMTVRVFSTPTCPHCPRAVVLAHEMAFANPHVTAYAIDATEFADLTRQFRVSGVPKTIVNDRVEILGAVPEEDFIAQALSEPGKATDQTLEGTT